MSCLTDINSPQSALVPGSERVAARPKQARSPLVKTYLFLYNVFNAAGWGYLLTYIIAGSLTEGASIFSHVWRDNTWTIGFFLLLVFGDAIHVLLGIVTPTAEVSVLLLIHCKVLRRLNLFGALYIFDKAQNKYAGIMLLIWCTLDLIRFPFYALNTWKMAPHVLAELRYFAELFLYPVSLIAEFLVWFEIFKVIVTTDNILAHGYMLTISGYLLWRLYSFPNNFRRMIRMANKSVNNKQ
jgi:very-long-chain (3R)-3-hydroxyacyl-CoA dehydratase